jgi:hypothetical protein
MKKKQMKNICIWYGTLYRLAPVKAWKAAIIRRHFETCPACKADNGMEIEPGHIGVSPGNARLPEDLWQRIESAIIARETASHPARPGRRRLITAAVAALMLLLILPFTLLRKHTGPRRDMVVQNRQIVIHSIRVEHRPAKTVIVQSGKKNRLIVWAGNPFKK